MASPRSSRAPRDARTDPAAAAQAQACARGRAALAHQPCFERALGYPAAHLPVLVSMATSSRPLVLAAFANLRTLGTGRRTHPSTQLLAMRAEVRLYGNDVAFNEINKRTSSDLARAEMFALPILLLLSFWVFRGSIAAVLPLLVGGFAIVDHVPAAARSTSSLGLSAFAVNLVTGIGLCFRGIDYSLFILSRYREDFARGPRSRTRRSAARCRPPGAPCCSAR